MKNRPERHNGRTTLHPDPTGHAACAAVDKERRNAKGAPRAVRLPEQESR